MAQDLEKLSNEELEQLIAEAKRILAERARAAEPVYRFEFEATNDPRKGTPYVARLRIGPNGKIEREFYDLDRQYGRREVTVSGTYEAREGDVIEIRNGGSWSRDYRSWYLVHDGQLHEVASIHSSKDKARVVAYMRGEIPLEDLLE